MAAKLDIKRAMKSRGVKLTELSEALGVKPQTIITYYNGNPNVGTLNKIADALKCDIRDLFFDDTNPYYAGLSDMQILMRESFDRINTDEEQQSNIEKFDGFHSILQAAEEHQSLPPDQDPMPITISAITPATPIQCPHCGKVIKVFHSIQTKVIK